MWEAIIGGVAALAGALLKNKGSAAAQQSANETNVFLNQENRQWMEDMSNTSYQRAVKDMQSAGLNPMLAYSQGGASTPNAAAPTVQPVPRFAEGLGRGIEQATTSAQQGVNIAQGIQSIQQSQAATEQARAQTEKIKSETMERDYNTAKLLAEVYSEQGRGAITEIERWLRDGTRAWSAKKAMAEGDIAEFEARAKEKTFEADVARRKHESSIAGTESELRRLELPRAGAEARMYERSGGDAIPYLGPLLDLVRGVSSAKRAFAPEIRR